MATPEPNKVSGIDRGLLALIALFFVGSCVLQQQEVDATAAWAATATIVGVLVGKQVPNNA